MGTPASERFDGGHAESPVPEGAAGASDPIATPIATPIEGACRLSAGPDGTGTQVDAESND